MFGVVNYREHPRAGVILFGGSAPLGLLRPLIVVNPWVVLVDVGIIQCIRIDSDRTATEEAAAPIQ